MSFFSKNFVFNGIPSETYGVYITNLGENESYTSGGGNIDINTQSVFRRSVPYFYGATQGNVLSFRCAITSPDEITAGVSRSISRWLFGHLEYKKLQITQEDMQMSYFNCFLNNPETLRIGNIIHGYSFDVVCDAPYAWEFPKTLTKTYTAELASEDFTFQNISDDNDYLYPELVITFNSFGGNLTVTNTSDSDREFTLTGLLANEVLTIDNDRGILSTDQPDLLRMDKFNKNWFRLVSGRNDLELSGNISSFVMNYNLARKVV